MAKKKKTPTPQELYFARKQREEQERDALLPPGMINHGNTCFMNSVLQGLLATQTLASLIVPPSKLTTASTPTPIARLNHIDAARSPQLMNGHGIGVATGDEQDWVQGMPLGDVFVNVMRKAWNIQYAKKRESVSPKPILTELGRKYDQYLDFAQQDAHEFLRQLLDAMRMEEMDIMKKRNPPPPPHTKERRRTTLVPNQPTASSSSQQQQQQPSSTDASFVDMLFNGQLTSILICQKCKNISHSYEDFNDLSLSIKPEDYARERKRDRLKAIAKKLRLSVGPVGGGRPGSSSGGGGLGTAVLGKERPASVPPPPLAREKGEEGELEVPDGADDELGRRSWDVVVKEDVIGPSTSVSISASDESTKGTEDDDGDGGDKVADLDAPLENEGKKERRKSKKDKDKDKIEDGWTKIGRRLSMIGGGKERKERRKRKKDELAITGTGDDDEMLVPNTPSAWSTTTVGSGSGTGSTADAPAQTTTDTAIVSPIPRRAPEIRFHSPSSPQSQDGPHIHDSLPLPNEERDKPLPARPPSSRPSSAASQSQSISISLSSRPSTSRPATPSGSGSSSAPVPRTKSPLGAIVDSKAAKLVLGPKSTSSKSKHGGKSPPKASRAEAEYLASILADIPPSSLSSPFGALFRPGHSHHHSHSHSHAHHHPHHLNGEHRQVNDTLSSPNTFNITSPPSSPSPHANSTWMKFATQMQMNTSLMCVEDCLRMFTAVETMEGDNLVGCRRCWKIANGSNTTREERRAGGEDSDGSDDEGESSGGSDEEEEEGEEESDGSEGDEDRDREGPLVNGTSSPPGNRLQRPRGAKLRLDVPPPSSFSRTNTNTHISSPSPGLSSVSTPVLIGPANFGEYYNHHHHHHHHQIARSASDNESVSSLPISGSRIPPSAGVSEEDLTMPVPRIGVTSVVGSREDVGLDLDGDGDMETPSTARLLPPPGIPPPVIPHLDRQSTSRSLQAPQPQRGVYRREGGGRGYLGTTDESDAADESDASSSSPARLGASPVLSRASIDGGGGGGVPPRPSLPSGSTATSGVSTTSTSATSYTSATSTLDLSPPPSESKPSPSQNDKKEGVNGKPPKKASRSSREKQVILRPHYKRYLVSKPPPVLVIHLKRFQQQGKGGKGGPMGMGGMGIGFASGFKKLDDLVRFEEVLDLTPFLAPRREDFGLGRRRRRRRAGEEAEEGVGSGDVEEGEKGRGKGREKCLYRLYAVVVHLGNMLGGHYIAYTALPPSAPAVVTSSSSTGTGSSVGTSSVDEKDASAGAPLKKSESPQRTWAYISDTVVRISSLEEVLKSKAYLCLYERYYPDELGS